MTSAVVVLRTPKSGLASTTTNLVLTRTKACPDEGRVRACFGADGSLCYKRIETLNIEFINKIKFANFIEYGIIRSW